MSTRFLRPVFYFTLGFAAAAFTRAADAADNIEWVSISLPASGGAGAMLQFNATVKNTGTTTWDGNCYLELKDATTGTPIDYPSVAGVQPGQTVSRMFLLYLPTATGSRNYTFKGMRHNVAYFGTSQTRTINIVAGAVNQGVTLTGPQNASGSYLLDTANLPFINSPDALTPNYRLRAKIINGSDYGWGHHAATTWNNKGLRLDSAPATPGTYPVTSLYWLKYDAFQGTLLEIGPERFVSVSVPGGTVALEHYSFGNLTPPKIFSNEPTLTGTYWLDATFIHPTNGQQWLATPRPANSPQGSHNNNQPLNAGALPPPGDYNLKLSWRRFDGLGNLFATGPDFPVSNVVIYQGEGPVLSVNDRIDFESGPDDDGNWGSWLTEDEHNFSTSITGTVSVSVSALFGVATEVVDGNDNIVTAGGSSLSFGTTGGNYKLRVRSADGGYGDYTATVDVFSGATAPSYASTSDSVTGEFGKSFTYDANAGGTGTVYSIDSGQLPPGLSLSNYGLIHGWPIAASPAGSPYVATIRAQNSLGHAIKTITFMISKAQPHAVFAGEIVENLQQFPITQDMLRGATNPSSLKLLRPAGAPEHVPLPTNTAAITFSATLPQRNNYFYPSFPPANYSGLIVADGDLIVSGRYPGDANYLAKDFVTTFANRDTMPPQFPAGGAGLTKVLVDATSVSLRWATATDYYSVLYDLSLNNGTTIAASGLTVASGVLRGLAANTTYQVVVRARDTSGNNSGNPTPWSPPLSFTTLSAPPTPSGAIQWLDVNGDGVRDEIIPSGTATFSYFPLPEQGREVTFTEWQTDFIYLPGYFYEVPDSYYRQAGDPPTNYIYIPGEFVPAYTEGIVTITLAQVMPVFQFTTEPGYGYDLARVHTRSNGNKVYRPIIDVSLAAILGLPGDIQEWLPGGPWLETSFDFFPTVLVRYAKPIGQLNVTMGNTAFSVPVGNAGTVTLPGLGTVPISGKITLPTGGISPVISVKDAVGNVIQAVAGKTVLWDIWDLVTSTRISIGGVSTSIDLGIDAKGRFLIGAKLDDRPFIYFEVEVPAPAVEVVSRDKFVGGTVTIPSEMNGAEIEFVNTTTGESLGRYGSLLGGGTTRIYNAVPDILSDADVAAGGQTQSQQVWFVRDPANTRALNFYTCFNALGTVEVRLWNGSTRIYTATHQLAAADDFAAWITYVDNWVKGVGFVFPGAPPPTANYGAQNVENGISHLARACLIPAFIGSYHVEGIFMAHNRGVMDGVLAGLKDDWELLVLIKNLYISANDWALRTTATGTTLAIDEFVEWRDNPLKRAKELMTIAVRTHEELFTRLSSQSQDFSSWEGWKRRAFAAFTQMARDGVRIWVVANQLKQTLSEGIVDWAEDFSQRMMLGAERARFEQSPWETGPLANDLVGLGGALAYTTGYVKGYLTEQVVVGLATGVAPRVGTVIAKGGVVLAGALARKTSAVVAVRMATLKRSLKSAAVAVELRIAIETGFNKALQTRVSGANPLSVGDYIESVLRRSDFDRSALSFQDLVEKLAQPSTQLQRLVQSSGNADRFWRALADQFVAMGDNVTANATKAWTTYCSKALKFDGAGNLVEDRLDDILALWRKTDGTYASQSIRRTFEEYSGRVATEGIDAKLWIRDLDLVQAKGYRYVTQSQLDQIVANGNKLTVHTGNGWYCTLNRYDSATAAKNALQLPAPLNQIVARIEFSISQVKDAVRLPFNKNELEKDLFEALTRAFPENAVTPPGGGGTQFLVDGSEIVVEVISPF